MREAFAIAFSGIENKIWSKIGASFDDVIKLVLQTNQNKYVLVQLTWGAHVMDIAKYHGIYIKIQQKYNLHTKLALWHYVKNQK